MTEELEKESGRVDPTESRIRELLRAQRHTGKSRELKTESTHSDRLTVIEKCYYQVYGESAKALPKSIYTRFLKSSEQEAYQRTYKIGEEWGNLDTGWIEDASMVIIKNLEGTKWTTIPSEKEREEVAKKVVRISYEASDDKHWVLEPGESMRGTPSHVQDLVLRCEKGEARITICIVPK